MSYNNRGAPSGPRRGQTQRIASGARSSPYSRPETSRMASSGSWNEDKRDTSDSKSWPPNQLTIRGSSGPTWITVANLLRGTTEADIHETFQQFGDIEGIQARKSPSENHPSIAFEVAFTSKASASLAIEKLDGALADGRLLQVSLRDVSKFNPSSLSKPLVSPLPATQPAAAPATPQRELMPTIPSGPRAQQQPRANNGRELLHPKNVQAQQQRPHSNQKMASVVPSLQSRLMSAAELKTFQRQQARSAAKATVVPGVPTGPKGTVSTPATSIPLAKRITLPLAMRLSEEAKKNGPASGKVPSGPSKKRKAKGKAKAKAANGMDID